MKIIVRAYCFSRTFLRALFCAFVVVTFAGFFSACSTVQSSALDLAKSLHIIEHTEVTPIPKDAPESYRLALQYLESGGYAQALEELESFLHADPTTPWTQAAILNEGRALEGLSRWSEAAQHYHSVISATADAPKLQAMALYRLSFCLEALSDDTSTVAVLNDLVARESHLPAEIGRAEVPARLAAAYARVGNFDRAVEFYNQAESGIAKLRSERAVSKNAKSKGVPEWLPRTLYYMGNMSFRTVTFDDFEIAMRPLAHGQIYLLQASEFGSDPWSIRASNALMKVYSNLWTVIETAPLPKADDPVIAKRLQQRRQWQLASLLLDAIVELQARALPKGTPGVAPQAAEILELASEIERKLGTLLQERPAGEGVTAEAAARTSGKSFHVISPDETLERKFLQSGRDVPSVGAPELVENPVKSSAVKAVEKALSPPEPAQPQKLPAPLPIPESGKPVPESQPLVPDAKPIHSTNGDPNL